MVLQALGNEAYHSYLSDEKIRLTFQGKASVVWDKFGTSPRQAINRGLMNHLGMVGSDTGIRTRILALRGPRPNP